jgi:hypothetical protein
MGAIKKVEGKEYYEDDSREGSGYYRYLTSYRRDSGNGKYPCITFNGNSYREQEYKYWIAVCTSHEEWNGTCLTRDEVYEIIDMMLDVLKEQEEAEQND